NRETEPSPVAAARFHASRREWHIPLSERGFARRLFAKERKSAPRFRHGYAAANRAICAWAALPPASAHSSSGLHAISSDNDRSGERNQALHRLHQLGACARPLRDADLPDRGNRA